MQSCVGPERTLQSQSANFYNYSSHSSRSIILRRAPPLHPLSLLDVQISPSISSTTLRLLLYCFAVAFLFWCIMYIPYFTDMCLLLSALRGAFNVPASKSSRLLGLIWEASTAHHPAKYTVMAIKKQIHPLSVLGL